MLRSSLFSAVALAITALPTTALAAETGQGSAQFSLGITGFVPVICRASLPGAVITPQSGRTSLGTLREFCNNAAGYKVVASYSPELASGIMTVDGREVLLQPGGSTVIDQSTSAAIASRELTLTMPAGVRQASVSISIQPV
ncbi:MAG: hypothetical protein KGJ57_09165 [Sphingomonadales bacterium]|nr:hypothetical protein [Sphingomonadales bacterium]MDE2169579.1 hypothetical protein [Sphingomonadales bacterium]